MLISGLENAAPGAETMGVVLWTEHKGGVWLLQAAQAEAL